MQPKMDRPAQSIRRSTLLLQAMFIVPLIVMLAGMPVRPVTAQPGSAPRLDLDPTGRITLPTGVSDGAFLWGDYDNDGDLDILASGAQADNTGKTTIFVNNGTSFSERTSGMEQVQFSSADWGDYDNDGDLDVLLTGQLRVEGGSSVVGFAGLYQNVASGGGYSFSLKQNFNNIYIYQGSGTFGDYNNDGLLDILLTGYTNGGAPYSRIWRNTGDFDNTVYSDSSTPTLTPLGASATTWGDYNRDGFMDFVISGKNADDQPTTIVYRNSGGASFTTTNLTGLWGGTVDFLDYNRDRYLDLLVTGNTGTNESPDIHPKTILYQYYGTSPYFREVPSTGLPDLWTSSVSVGDYDNDGYPDLAMGGKTLTGLPNQVFRNNHDGTFSNVNAGLSDGAGTMLAWGDFNGDKSLDLSLTGVPVYDPGTGEERIDTYIYPNKLASPNTAPMAPTMEAACWNASNQRLTLIWKNATDTPVNANSLSYSVRVGTTVNGQDIVSPSSNLSSGYRRFPAMGNNRAFVPGAIANLPSLPSGVSRYSAILRNPPAAEYYWSVQAIDSSYVGGPFDSTAGRVIDLGTEVANSDTFDVLDSATDVEMDILSDDNGAGSPLAIYSFSNPSHGTLARDPGNSNQLIYNPTEPYEGTDSFTYYAIRTNSLYCTRALVSIRVTQGNDKPTDITLSNNLVPDGAPVGTLVGDLITTDPDTRQTFEYFLPPGGAPDNASFTISGGQLLTNTTVDYAAKSEYSIRVRSTDQGGLFVEKNFTIWVIPNQRPTDIRLSASSVLERQAVGTPVGTLTTVDPDTSDKTFTYTLVSYQGSTYDNESFDITVDDAGARLVTGDIFDYNDRQAYQVAVRSTDRGGKYFEKVFSITILPSTPSLSTAASFPVIMSEDGINSYGDEDPFQLALTATDPGIGEVLTWSIRRAAYHGTASVASGTTTSGQQKQILYTPQENWNSADQRGDDSFIVRVTDLGGHTAEFLVTVNVRAINDLPLFNVVAEQLFFERSGLQTVAISGIQSGPLFETSQFVTLAAQCPVDAPCDPTITNFSATPVQADGTATISFLVGPGTGTFTLVVVARDNQNLNNTFSRSFPVTIIPGVQNYLPVIGR